MEEFWKNVITLILALCGAIFAGYMIAKLWENHDKLIK